MPRLSRRSRGGVAVRILMLVGGVAGPFGLGASTVSAQTRVHELIAPKTIRFFPPTYPREQAVESLALLPGTKAVGAATSAPRVKPAFSRAETRATPDGPVKTHVEATVQVETGTSLYGCGEIAGPLLRNGRTSVCWNTDAYAYKEETPSLYQSHPWVLAVRADGTAYGVLADTTYRCEIDLSGDQIRFRADGPADGFPVVVIDRASPLDVVQGLADITGHMPMPPKWALGYHQCRYSYNPESKAREIAAGFRSRQIPCDVIWFDIDYMDGYRVFTFDSKQFPDPTKLNSDLHGQGFHTIWMIDPGVKAEPGFKVFDSGTAGNHWLLTSGGEVYKGAVWPGQCVFPDYTRPETRAWWAGLYKDFLATVIDGVWNDMNEPAIFNVASKTMPEDVQHRGGDGLPAGPHARYHNVYGMLMARATREGIAAANPDKRPFVLTRANYIGGQRYAATWTGDNSAEWIDLENSIPMALNLGLSGQPFAGPDIGGFNGNGDGKLFARWMGFGSLLPFSRGHTAKGNIDKEPWAFGPEVEKTCKAAIERRYRLMPYLYTMFREAARYGSPVARPVFFADPSDLALRSEDDAFLLGGDLMVSAKVTPLGDRRVAMPKAPWTAMSIDADPTPNPDLAQLFIRPGAIIPVGPVMEYTSQKPLDPLELYVCPGGTGFAEGKLYEDAGDGFGYEKDEFLLTRYTAKEQDGVVTVQMASREGKMAAPARRLIVRYLSPSGVVTAEGKDGETIRIPLKK